MCVWEGGGISTLQKMGGIMSTYSKMGRGDLSRRDFVRHPFSIDDSDRSLRWNELNFTSINSILIRDICNRCFVILCDEVLCTSQIKCMICSVLFCKGLADNDK